MLTRQVPLGQALELATLARKLDLDPAQVAFALMKLASEQLVSRTADGQYQAAPLTAELADEMFDAPPSSSSTKTPNRSRPWSAR